DIWAGKIASDVEITIDGSFISLQCDASSATLAQASPTSFVRDFPGAPLPATYYPVALANKLAGIDLQASTSDISVQFNSDLGKPTCLAGSGWYYGLNRHHGDLTDLVTVLLHEMGHGLGFLTQVTLDSGAEFLGRPDIYETHIFDTQTGKHWPDMTATERKTSALNARHIIWDGAHVTQS